MLISIVAVVGGFAVTAILVVVGTAVATAAILRDPARDPTAVVPALYLAVNLALSLLAAVAGGYVCSWIAPTRPFVHAVALAGFFEALSLATAVTSGAAPGQPTWYPWVIGLICASGVIAGGAIRIAVANSPA
jgi:hypothetical protein